MYLTAGNALVNPHVGLLFIDFERRRRMRLNGVASVAEDDPLLAEYPEAQLVVRVRATEVFPNCPRYIHEYRLVERSRFVPARGVLDPRPRLEDTRVGSRRPAPRRPGYNAWRRSGRALKAHWIALGGIVAGSAALLALGTTRVKEWTVMTDELLYTKLAQHFADTGSPLPVLHGEHVGFLGVVYSILLAPFYAALDPVAAFDAAHVLNAVLFASAAIPVYLLGAPRRSARVRARRRRAVGGTSVGSEHGDGDVGVRRLPRLRLGRARLPRRARRGRRRVVTHSRSAPSRSPSSRVRSSWSSQACCRWRHSSSTALDRRSAATAC